MQQRVARPAADLLEGGVADVRHGGERGPQRRPQDGTGVHRSVGGMRARGPAWGDHGEGGRRGRGLHRPPTAENPTFGTMCCTKL